MVLKSIVMIFIGILLLNGCSSNSEPQYDGSSYEKIKSFDFGRVIASRGVVVSDDGSGAFFGSLIGAILGSTIGSNTGSVLMSLGGGIAGRAAGKEVAKADANELTVELTNGETIIIVVKDETIKVGDKIRIIKEGNKVAQIDKIEEAEKEIQW